MHHYRLTLTTKLKVVTKCTTNWLKLTFAVRRMVRPSHFSGLIRIAGLAWCLTRPILVCGKWAVIADTCCVGGVRVTEEVTWPTLHCWLKEEKTHHYSQWRGMFLLCSSYFATSIIKVLQLVHTLIPCLVTSRSVWICSQTCESGHLH